jgi:transposase
MQRETYFPHLATSVPKRPSCAGVRSWRSSKTIAVEILARGGFVQSGFYEVALTPDFEAPPCHATSQNPQDSRITGGMIQSDKRRVFAMGQAVPVRTNYSAGEVRRLGKQAKDTGQARRLLAIAAVLDGASREDAAKIGGMDRQTLRDWVIRFNEQGPDGLINIPSPGAPPKLDDTHRAFLARIVEEGPIPAVHGVVRWRACDLIMRP